MKRRVQLAQLNSAYGDNVYIPYTIGMLQAYAEQFDEIKENFEFSPYLYKRERIATMMEKIGNTKMLFLKICTKIN